MDRSRASALVILDKHRKRKNLLRRSYLRKIKCARQNYKPEDVLAAMRAIWKGMSRRQAAKIFNIPRSTLLDKLDGKRPVDASPGPNPFLTKAEECTLEAWAVDLHQRGFPLKTEDLKDMAQAVIQNNQRRTSFKNGRPGRSWMRNFLLRHPRVFEISTDMTPGPRRSRTVTTREEARQWCQQHRRFMALKGYEHILDHPDRVFNVDHGEFLFDAVTGQLLDQERFDRTDEKDRDKPENLEKLSSGTECVSIVATFTAAGGMAPIMMVGPSKINCQEETGSLPPGWICTHSKNGHLTSKIFLDYMVAFRRWLDQETITLPVLLLVDGRRSRLNMDVTHYCEEHGIILYCLFPTPRPAISELFSSILHDSLVGITKHNFATKLHEALTLWAESDNTGNVLPHLQSMLQTLADVRTEPLTDSPPPLLNNFSFLVGNHHQSDVVEHGQEESDCEFDYELTPVEGEIEIEFSDSENCDPCTLARHPALLADPDIPGYLVYEVPPKPASSFSSLPSTPAVSLRSVPIGSNSNTTSIEDRIDQPGVGACLVIKPLSSPLQETENGIAKVDFDISEVISTLLSMGTSHQADIEDLSVIASPVPTEEPFLGFSPDNESIQNHLLDAYGCIRFMERFLVEKNLLENFKVLSHERKWNGVPEATLLFQMWLAAKDESRRKLKVSDADSSLTELSCS